jgi:hypothetical protein
VRDCALLRDPPDRDPAPRELRPVLLPLEPLRLDLAPEGVRDVACVLRRERVPCERVLADLRPDPVERERDEAERFEAEREFPREVDREPVARPVERFDVVRDPRAPEALRDLVPDELLRDFAPAPRERVFADLRAVGRDPERGDAEREPADVFDRARPADDFADAVFLPADRLREATDREVPLRDAEPALLRDRLEAERALVREPRDEPDLEPRPELDRCVVSRDTNLLKLLFCPRAVVFW